MWSQFCPTTYVAGTVPENAVAELPSIEAASRPIIEDSKQQRQPQPIYQDAIVGLRPGVLIEGIYYLHKAAHACGAAQLDAQTGLCSWSTASAYQAAAFAAKGILSLVGFSLLQVSNHVIISDVCAWEEDRHRQRGQSPKIKLVWAHKGLLEHRPVWSFFQRMLRVCKIPDEIWPAEWLGSLRKMEEDQFSSQRNRLFYGPNHWPLDDLHKCVVHQSFVQLETVPSLGEILGTDDRPDFTLVLAFVLLRMGELLLADLAKDLAAVRDELHLMQTWHGQSFNSRYRRIFPV
jgi:hypothetical protein